MNSHDGYLSCTCKIGQPNQPIWWQSFALSWSVLKMPLWGLNFLHILEIPSSSRHEKRCQMLKRHFGVFKYSRKHLQLYQQFQILKDFLTVMNAIVFFIKTLTFLKNYYSCMNLRKALLANVRFLRQRGWGITTWIMEFIGKRSHKKAVREWGCVRSIGRTTRSQESSLRCAGWVEEAFFAGATLPQLCLPVGMQQLFAPSSTVDTVQDFLIKSGIKPHMHLWEISIFSLNNIIVRPTKSMNRVDKNWAQF